MSDKPSNEVKILAVEDDPGDFGLIRVYLRLAGYGVDVEQNTVSWATSVAEAKSQSASNIPDIVLLDLNLPDSSGLATVIEIRNALPGVPIIVLSGNDNKEVAIAALKEGAQDYLVKGHYEHDALGKAVLHALVRSRLEARLRLFEVALNSAGNAIVITDQDALIQWANPAFTKLTGYTLEEASGRKPGELLKSGKQDQPFYQALWETILSGSIWNGKVVNRRKDGGLYHEELSIAPVMDYRNKITNFVAVKQDITERHEMEEKVHQLAFYDPLTKLPNRRLMDDRLVHAMSASKRSGRYAALMELDLDNFKPLNDLHGHAAGDLLLIEVANRMRGCVREVDTIARYGGDEFIIILSELDLDKATSTAQAAIVAEKIRTSLAVPYLLTIKNEQGVEAIVEHRCTSSIGLVVFVNQENNQDNLIKCADMAMYQAKEAGRNTIRFHEE